jgi:hypothetical protein
MPVAARSACRALLVALASVGMVSCGGGGAGPDTVTFAFRIHGLGPAEEFRVDSASPGFIASARGQLALPAAQRRLFPAGSIRSGNGGYNLDWSWHFTSDVALAEVSIELCDARPSMVEADLRYWLRTVRSFCPWGAYVAAELS